MNPPPGIGETWMGLPGKVVTFSLEGGHSCRILVERVKTDPWTIIGRTTGPVQCWWEFETRRIVALMVEDGGS